MTHQLVDFQEDCVGAVYGAYRNGARNVGLVCPTGAGKTVMMGHMAHEYAGFGVSIAHRGELVGQMSLALAREGMRHDIIAPDGLIRAIVGAHMEEIGRSYYDARAKWKVASVDTIIRRELPTSWTRQVGMAHVDEGHHVLETNKWGRALSIFDNAYGLLPTATLERADGKGLGRHAHGVIDAFVEGPKLRWLINNGYLCNYVIRGITTADLDLDGIPVGPSGELDMDELRRRTKASRRIIGDIVGSYLEFARGKKGITFAVDVEHAHQIAEAYNLAGVPAKVVHSGTPEGERNSYMRMFKRGELLQLVNVDLFGEGVDVPAVEVISMARKTNSYGLYVQQFGRALRLLVSPILRAAWHTYTPGQRLQFIAESTKPHAIIIDHVGNVIRHGGPPDWRKTPWSLDARERKTRAEDSIAMRLCINKLCLQPYERIHPRCPYCNTEPPPPTDRSRPEFVDGDMVLYTEELLKQLFGAKHDIDSAFVAIPYGVSHNSAIAGNLRNIHARDQASQALLRQAMELVMPPGLDERVAQRRFFHTFGVDTLSAQGLTSSDAEKLRQLILTKVTGK